MINRIYKIINNFLISDKFLWTVIVFGMLLRLRQYLAYRSLWVDEAKYAVKIMDYSYAQIFDLRQVVFDPFTVKFETAGPVGFFYASKLLTQLLGNSEYILRLIPFACSIGAIFLMIKLAQKYLEPLGVVVVGILFSIDRVLILRSADFHPYASDVIVTLLLFLMVLRLNTQKLTIKDIISYGFLGAIAVLFSLSAIFVLVGVGGAFIVDAIIGKKKDVLCIGAWIVFFWLVSFMACYFGYLKTFSSNMNWPEGGYITSMLDINGLYHGFRDIFTEEPMRFRYWGFPAVFFLWGIISMFLKDKRQLMYLVFPILATLLASLMGKYPFSGRLILFLTPIFIIFIAEGAVSVVKFFPLKAWPVSIFLLIGLLFHPFITSAKEFVRPTYREEIRPIIAHVASLKKNDPVYVYAYAGPAFHYYAHRFGLDEKKFIVDRYHHGSPETELVALNAFKGKEKVWIVYSHVNNPEGRQFFSYLEQIGEKEGSYLQPGAGALLYNFNP